MKLDENPMNSDSLTETPSEIFAFRRYLLVRPQPKQDESWPGYLLRLANANGYAGLSTIAGLCGGSVRNLVAYPQWERLRSLGIEVTQRSFHCPGPMLGRLYAPTWITTSSRSRVCPECIASMPTPYIPSHWDSPLLAECKQHALLLVDQCDKCSRIIDYRRYWLDACKCGRKFRDVIGTPRPVWFKTFEWVFAESSDETVECVQKRKRRDFDAARTVTAMTLLSDGKDLKKLSGQKGAFVGAESVASLATWFTCWPADFRSQLSKYFDFASASSKRLGKRVMRASTFHIIDHQFEEITSISPLGSRRGRKAYVAGRPAVHVSLARFGEMTRLGHSLVRTLVEGGHLPVAAGEPDSIGRRLQLVEVEIARKIQALHERTYSVDEAATLLKCSAMLVRVMVRLGQLPAWSGFPGFRSMAVVRLRLDEIAAALRALDGMAAPEREAVGGRIALESALGRCLSVNVLEVRYAALLGKIRSGRLTLYRSHAPAIDLAGFSLDEAQFLKCFPHNRAYGLGTR